MTRKELKDIIAEALVEMGVVSPDKPQPTTPEPQPTSRYSIGEEDGSRDGYATRYGINS